MISNTAAPLSIAARTQGSVATALVRLADAIRRGRKERELAPALDHFSRLSPHLMRDMGVTCDPRAPLEEMIRQSHACHGR